MAAAQTRMAVALEKIAVAMTAWTPGEPTDRPETLGDKVAVALDSIAGSAHEISEAVQDAEWARKKAAGELPDEAD